MRPVAKGKGYEILNLIEMLNGENIHIKEVAIHDLQGEDVTIGRYAHDCACRYNKWEG